MSVVQDARDFLWRYGTNTDTTIDPIDLIRDLVKECEKRSNTQKRPPPSTHHQKLRLR